MKKKDINAFRQYIPGCYRKMILSGHGRSRSAGGQGMSAVTVFREAVERTDSAPFGSAAVQPSGG